MALRVGMVGIGFMGKVHFDAWQRTKGARVSAICDIDPKKRSGNWSGIGGNIGGAGKKTDLRGIRVYSDAIQLFSDPSIDAVDLTLPTYLHASFAIRALQAGKHVICEKPMAINSSEAARMASAAKRSGKMLFIAHCIRFWPHYAVLRDIIRSRRYGKVISAAFRRVSSSPTWSWQNWIQDPKKSGLAALDLHIHDADFILHVFGKPRTVTSSYAGLKRGRMDHIHTAYGYADGQMVSAEGAWEYAPKYPFAMSFTVAMEGGTLNMTPDLSLKLYLKNGGTKAVAVPAGDGYSLELAHFAECIRKNRPSDTVSPESAMASVKLVECEVKSALGGKAVRVSF